MEVILDKERYIENPFLGSVDGFDVYGSGPDSFRQKLEKGCSQLLATFVDKLKMEGLGTEASVYTGHSGIILTFFWIKSRWGREPDPWPDQVVNEYVENVSKGAGLRGKRFSFLCGDAGPLAIAYIMAKDDTVKTTLMERLLKLQDVVFASSNENELLYGRAGYLYALLFLNQECGEMTGGPPISKNILEKLASIIVEDGLRHRRKAIAGTEFPPPAPLHYEWHEKIYLGAAHGYVGILYILLKAKPYLSERHVKVVKETLDWVLQFHQFPSGNIRSSVGSKEDKLVHWCHGAPGSVFLLLEAAKVFPDQSELYLSKAAHCGEVVWRRGILKRSYSLCHGTSGNAYALLALYKHTKDPLWLRRSCLFAQHCIDWGKEASRVPDRPHSLFEGLAGTLYMLHDFHFYLFKGRSSGSGSTPKFPAFELD